MNGLSSENVSTTIKKNAGPERVPLKNPEHTEDVYIMNTADPGKLMPGRRRNASASRKESKAEYGIISLFDGVSTVVPILQRKIGYAPTVVVLAEMDMTLRALVCAEYGYRTDQTWGRTKHGSACVYVKDVNTLLNHNCRILKDSPNAKWIIVGGSPCQELTFAGAFKGLLGLVGKNSRLFFILLGTIRAMQELAQVQSVQYLIENAGSMMDLHYHAFCELLGLAPQPKSRFLWDPADYGFGITRKRNFFRNNDAMQEVVRPHPPQFDKGGPLLTREGKATILPPLLRTRNLLQFEVCWASWTLYQPSALIWDYDFWGGPAQFAANVRTDEGKIPQLQWEDIIPPPFLQAWKQFWLSCKVRRLAQKVLMKWSRNSFLCSMVRIYKSLSESSMRVKFFD